MNHFVLILFAIFLPFQASHASNIFWLQNSATVAVDEKWAIYGEIQPRWASGFQNAQSIILRTALLYRVTPEWRVGLGFGHTPQFLPTIRNENRVFQQLDWMPSKSGAIEGASRTRFEQRKLEGGSELTLRLREKAQISWMPSAFGLYVWDEIFFSLSQESRVVNAGFDQNRLSFGPRYRKDLLLVELGYLLQSLRTLQNTSQSNSGILLNLGLSI